MSGVRFTFVEVSGGSCVAVITESVYVGCRATGACIRVFVAEDFAVAVEVADVVVVVGTSGATYQRQYHLGNVTLQKLARRENVQRFIFIL